MDQTRIFVSSTFFDLAQVREDMSRAIDDLGHIPVMSELDSFAVIPNLNTVENCKRNVRNADLFVLIIGGRRGSVDPGSSKPVTLVEYEAAIESGLDIFVFIYEPILTMLRLWEKNPEADFSDSVESVDVFKFVKRIRESQQWTFSFKYASEITTILRTQLSTFFRFLLDKKRGGRLEPLPQFKDESPRAKHLVSERLAFWEYELADELLRPRIIKLQKALADLENGLVLRRHRVIRGQEFSRWIRGKLPDFKAAVMLINSVYTNELVKGFGAAGESGDPIAILEAIHRIEAGCTALIEWEADAVCTHPPEGLEPVREAMIGSTREILNEVATLPDKLANAVRSGREHTSTEPLKITIALTFTYNKAKNFEEAINQVTDHPDWFQ